MVYHSNILALSVSWLINALYLLTGTLNDSQPRHEYHQHQEEEDGGEDEETKTYAEEPRTREPPAPQRHFKEGVTNGNGREHPHSYDEEDTRHRLPPKRQYDYDEASGEDYEAVSD